MKGKTKKVISAADEAIKMQNLELESDSSTNAIDASDTDVDVCPKEELQSYFPTIKTRSDIGIKDSNTYVLFLSATKDSNPSIAAGYSNHLCEVYKLNESSLHNSESITASSQIIDVKFSTENPQMLYVGTSEEGLQLWDLRTTQKPVVSFKDTSHVDSQKRIKPLTCFDVSFDNRLIAGGTELYEGDAFIMFWDVRNNNLMGGYWESHTDDITQVKFHLDDTNKLISGSTDGLINVFDLSQTTEDDALIDSLNTESSVKTLNWFKQKDQDAISCITHTEDLQLWTLEHAMPFAHYKRAQIAEKIMRSSEGHCYIAGTHPQLIENELLVLAGSYFQNGECFRALNYVNDNLSPAFSLVNKQRICSTWYNPNCNLLICGGEKGLITAWSLKNEGTTTTGNKSKKLKKH